MVIHYGDGRWFVIDSCLNPFTKKPIAQSYLESIGVDVATQVDGILITHWHADHISGAFELLKACSRAKLYFSAALHSSEAFHLAAMFNKDLFTEADKEIREFRNIVEFLRASGDQSRLDPVKAQHMFFDYKGGINTRLLALSPSSTAVTQSIAKIVSVTPRKGAPRLRGVVQDTENSNAVAIYFSYGDFSALLGSDLEDSGNSQTGWSAILNGGIFNRLSLTESSVYKVAHHGSNTGHHDQIWTKLLTKCPLSIATPYSRSSLPTSDDVQRIKLLSSEFLITRDPNSRGKTRRDSMVEREMKGIVEDRKVINDKMGHIQVRVPHSGLVQYGMTSNCVRA